MALIHDLVTAGNITGYYNEVPRKEAMLGEQYFPARKQLGTELKWVIGANGQPVVLRASALDTKVTIRERINLETNKKKIPFFKESMVIDEDLRQELNLIQQTNNQDLIDMIMTRIMDDQTTLLRGAHARLEAMRMQLLANGVIYINSNGIFQEIDYNVPASHKGVATIPWTDAAADPIQDIEDATEALRLSGAIGQVMVLNTHTYGLLRNAASTTKRVVANATEGYKARRTEIEEYLRDEFGLGLKIEDRTFVDDDGVTKKYFPDGKVSITPNSDLGYTVFGTTPEESDLQSGNNLDVSIVDTGIAITTKTESDPVNVITKVSMMALPSFEGMKDVYMLDVVTVEEPVDPEV